MKKNKVEGPSLLDFRTYNKVTVLAKRQIDQWHTTDITETNPHNMDNRFFFFFFYKGIKGNAVENE